MISRSLMMKVSKLEWLIALVFSRLLFSSDCFASFCSASASLILSLPLSYIAIETTKKYFFAVIFDYLGSVLLVATKSEVIVAGINEIFPSLCRFCQGHKRATEPEFADGDEIIAMSD